MVSPMPSQPPPANSDVRQRGFAARTTVDAAQAWVDCQVGPPAKETISLAAAAGRVLASDIHSPCNVPGFARAMMDGFAVCAEDTHGGGPLNGLPLELLGDALPGIPFEGLVTPGTAVRITTGAPLPAGASAVLPVEQVRVEDQRVWALGEVPPGKHVGLPGEDVASGQRVLTAGRKLRPQDLGVLASIGCAELSVCRGPPRPPGHYRQ